VASEPDLKDGYRLPFPRGGLLDRRDAAWLPDGSALLVVAGQTPKTTVNPEGVKRPTRQGVFRWTEAGGFQPLYQPPGDDADVASLAISATGQAVVEVIRAAGTQEASQLYLFDPSTGQIGEQLTHEDSNTAPDW
jgi:hypothetical protein